MAGLTVHTNWRDGQPLLTVAGELDLATVEVLKDRASAHFDEPGFHDLTVDLAELTFIDSSGLGALYELRNAARARGGRFRLEQVPAGPSRIIAIAGLASTFGLPDSQPTQSA